MSRIHLFSRAFVAAGLLWLTACSNDVQRVDTFDGEWRRVGTLKNGKKHGQWLTIGADGSLWQLKTWRNGYQHGLARSWWDNGALLSDAIYRHDRAHGRNRYFWDDGKPSLLGWNHLGRPIGVWCHWDEDGRLEKLVEYFDGRKVREDAAPEGPCPLTQGPGRRHLDPNDMNYE